MKMPMIGSMIEWIPSAYLVSPLAPLLHCSDEAEIG